MQFRNRIAAHIGLPNEGVVLAANATVALEAALYTHRTPEGFSSRDELWTLPSWSFVATGLAAKRANLQFQFADVALETGVLDISQVRPGVRTLGVAPFGSSIKGDNFQGFSLIDAAASFDAFEGAASQLGPLSGAVLSFHSTKSLSSGEGGAFVSADLDWVERVRSYVSFGFERGGRFSAVEGTNAKLSEVTAAFGLASLDRWRNERNSWLAAGEFAKEISIEAGRPVVGALDEGFVSPYWVLKLRDAQEVERLEDAFADAGIPTRRWWERGMHLMPAFKGTPILSDLANTRDWGETSIGLPFHPRLTRSDFQDIRKVLLNATRGS